MTSVSIGLITKNKNCIEASVDIPLEADKETLKDIYNILIKEVEEYKGDIIWIFWDKKKWFLEHLTFEEFAEIIE